MSFNRFGAAYTDALPLYPNTVAADFGGQAAIEGAIDRAVDLILGSLTQNAYQALTAPELVRVVARATAGQTVAGAPRFVPAVANSAHVWVGYATEFFERPRRIYDRGEGLVELNADRFTFTASTGVVTLGTALAADQQVYLSYQVDVSNASFSVPSLARLAILGAAAELGARLYTQASQQWALVEEYKDAYADALTRLRSGDLVPEEIRLEAYWSEVERSGPQGGSVDLLRG